jgi:hypothetical protein
LEDSTDDSPPLVAAPRHLRRRRFRNEIPDGLLVPESSPIFSSPLPPDSSEKPKPASTQAARASARRRKRAIALSIMTLIAFAIPALVFALIYFR